MSGCTDEQKLRRRERNVGRTTAGLCTYHGKIPLRDGLKRSSRCADMRTSYMQDGEAGFLAAGMCSRCGRVQYKDGLMIRRVCVDVGALHVRYWHVRLAVEALWKCCCRRRPDARNAIYGACLGKRRRCHCGKDAR